MGHGAAVYVGLTMSILTGPTALATPPMLRLSLFTTPVLAREAVAVPRTKAALLATNPRREEGCAGTAMGVEEEGGLEAAICTRAGT